MAKRVQVALTESIASLGKEGDLVEVAPGYAVGFNPTVQYAFRARLIGIGASSKLAIHFSGSSFGYNNSDLDKTWGYQLEVDEQLAEIQVPDTADEYDFGEVAETFTPDLSECSSNFDGRSFHKIPPSTISEFFFRVNEFSRIRWEITGYSKNIL